MIKYVNMDGRTVPAIVIECLDDIQAIRELRKGLVDVLETCVLTEETKDCTKHTSLWYLIRLIDETTIECPEKKGGKV